MIYLAHGDDARRKVIEATLELLDHEVALSTGAPSVLVRRCQEHPPDIAIVGTAFEEEDIFGIVNELGQQQGCPVIALLQEADIDRSRRLMNDQVMGILVEPAHEGDLRTSIYLARRRFRQARNLESRISDLQSELDGDAPSGELP